MGVHWDSSVRGREIGRRLRQVQRESGLTGPQLGEQMGWSPSMLSRTLTGVRVPTPVEAATMLVRCGVPGEQPRQAMLRLIAPYQDDGLHLPSAEVWPVFVAHAERAARLVEFAPFVLPWLLQTPAYTTAVITDTDAGDDAQAPTRQTATTLLGLPAVAFLVHEWSLRTPMLDAAGMSEQLHHLLRLSVRPSVSLRVVPIAAGAAVARHGAFTLLRSHDHVPVLYREDPVTGVFLDHDPAVDAYLSIADRLAAVALDEQQSRDLIARIATGLGSDVTEEWRVS